MDFYVIHPKSNIQHLKMNPSNDMIKHIRAAETNAAQRREHNTKLHFSQASPYPVGQKDSLSIDRGGVKLAERSTDRWTVINLPCVVLQSRPPTKSFLKEKKKILVLEKIHFGTK